MKTVIFDLDGVLIDSEKIYMRIESQLLKDFGISPNKALSQSFTGTKMVDNWTNIKKIFGLNFSVNDLVEKEKLKFLECIENNEVEKFDDAYILMKNLFESGYNLGIGTSSSSISANKLIKRFGFDELIKSIITSDDVSFSKPAPDIFLAVAKNLDADPSSCVVVEDSQIGIKSAKAAGMKCIARKNENNDNYEGADLIVSSLSEITQEIIEKL